MPERDLRRGLRLFLQRLGQEHPRYTDALTLEHRLRENIANTQQYGDSETLRSDRARIIESLNELALQTVGVSFNELCEQGNSALSHADIQGLLEAMGYRIADSRAMGTDLSNQGRNRIFDLDNQGFGVWGNVGSIQKYAAFKGLFAHCFIRAKH